MLIYHGFYDPKHPTPPLFRWVLRPEHQHILRLLSRDPLPEQALPDASTRFVGGAVRNSLLNKPGDDFDLATIHPPSTVRNRLEEAGIPVIDTGIDHGTVTALTPFGNYEITTLRQDVATDGRHAVVAFTNSFLEDARRRDFTMNALYLDAQGRLYDFFKGFQAIQDQRVEFIGCPQTRIQEDYLRILRFFRMNAWYGKPPFHSESYQACLANLPYLKKVSQERFYHEFMKLLKTDRCTWVLSALAKEGALEQLMGFTCNLRWFLNYHQMGRPAYPSCALDEELLSQVHLLKLGTLMGSYPSAYDLPFKLKNKDKNTLRWFFSLGLEDFFWKPKAWMILGGKGSTWFLESLYLWLTFWVDKDLKHLELLLKEKERSFLAGLPQDVITLNDQAYHSFPLPKDLSERSLANLGKMVVNWALKQRLNPCPIKGGDMTKLGYLGGEIGKKLGIAARWWAWDQCGPNPSSLQNWRKEALDFLAP